MKDTFSTIVGILSIIALLVMVLTYTGVLDEAAKDMVMPIVGILIFHEGYIRYDKNKLWGLLLMVLSGGGFLVILWRIIS
jgi:TctA family transporter